MLHFRTTSVCGLGTNPTTEKIYKMSNQQVNKVDLSLDDIIKLNKKAKQSRGGNNRTQGNAGARGQGVRGRKNAGGRGGGGGGASPLLKKKAGMTGGAVRGQASGQRGQAAGRRGQGAGRRGQRGNLRGRGGSSSSSRGGSVARNANSGYNTSTRGFRTGGIRGIRREELHPALELAKQAGFALADIENKLSQVSKERRLKQLQSEHRNVALKKVVLDKRYDRERLLCESDDLLVVYDCKSHSMMDWFIRKDKKLTHFEEDAQNCVKMWSAVSREKYRLMSDLISVNTAILASAIRHVLGARGNIRGSFRGRGNANNQGIMQRVGVQGQGDGLTNRISLKQKRQLAMQALRQARKTIAQLDQQNARQTVVNARRGIPQQNVQNPRPLGKKKQGMYSSNLSLVSSSSLSSAGSARQLQGTKVTTFNTSASPDPSLSPQNTRNKRRRWRAKSQTPSLPGISSSTLTISIDNAPSLSHSAPHVSNAPAAPAPRQQRQRRRQWRRQNSNSSFDSVDVNVNRGAAPSFDSVDMNRGATPSFAQQLAKLKPTSTTKYVFQKKAFSTGNTTLPLNDRFSGSGSEDIMGRKVFM